MGLRETGRTWVRRVKPIHWRDQLIARQKESLEQARAELKQLQTIGRPSFYFKHHEARRIGRLLRRHGARDVVWKVNDKDAGCAFAASHGVRTPEMFARYPDASSIDWDELPAEFVLKTITGTGSRGVLPLVRDGETYRDLLDGERALSRAEIVEYLDGHVANRAVSRQLVVEELLRSPYPQRPGLALDVKVYCFYGVVGMVMLRCPGGSRNHDQMRARYFDPDGNDLGAVMAHVQVDPALPEPLRWTELLDAAQRLSAAIPAPFVRLDFYEQPDGIVFGEVTPSPGGKQTARRDIDLRLGELWEDAEARLRAEIIAAAKLQPRPGSAQEMRR